jgi:AAA domain
MNTFDFLSPGGQPVLVCRLPNERGKGKPVHRYVHNETELQGFIATYNEPGYALYHAVAIFKEGAWRNKQNVEGTRYIWTEVDFKDHPDLGPEEIRRRIGDIPPPLKPTAIIFSGHGYHLYWQLKEDADARPGEAQQRVEEALKLAVNYVSGDAQVAEAARIMRLPGSHNTRVPGEELPVVFDEVELSRAHDLNELVDFFLEATPILPTPAKKTNGNGHDAGGFDFNTDAAQSTSSGPTDVDERLAAMRFKGAGDNAVNVTQRDVTASLTGRGRPVEETVARVLAATKVMAATDERCKDWNWGEEECGIRELCYRFINKTMRKNGEDLGHCLPNSLYNEWNKRLAEGRRPVVTGNGSGVHIRGYDWEKRADAAPGDGAQSGPASEETEGNEQPGNGTKANTGGDPKPPDLLGDVWHFGDPIAEQTPMLVPDLVPAHGFGNLGGQWGTMKTFILNDLAVALACGGVFAGRQVTVRGAVVSIELEGSHNEARMIAAAMARNCQREKLPIIHLKKAPPKILVNRNPNPRFKEYAAALVTYARAFAAARGVPLVLIAIDPQNRIAGYTDEQSSAEGQIVSDALTELARAAGCTVLVSDHFGKDPSAGLRGTSAKETNPLFILNTSEQQKDVFAQRYLEIRKMRNGPQGMAIDFKMEKCDALVDQIIRDKETGTTSVATTTVATLQVLWSDELRPVEFQTREKATTTGDGLTPKSRRALKILNELVDDIGLTIPPSCGAPPGSRGVTAKVWADCLVKQKGLGGKNPMAGLSHLMEPLIAQDKIGAADGLVWPTQIEDDSNTSE